LTAPSKPPWDRQPGEPEPSYARFRIFLDLGPSRSLAAIARAAGVSRQAVAQTAQRWNWELRAAAHDDHAVLADCQAPGRLHEAAAAAPIRSLVTEATRQAEREFLALLEQFRGSVEALARDEFQVARGMVAVSRRSVAKLLEEGRTLSARDLPAFVNSTVILAAAAQHQWGKSIGVDRLLLQMEQAMTVADAEVLDLPDQGG
jgi:BMFP domain-containing protein YqiC